MKKVYQTIVDVGKGNCLQAVIASLLELPLEEVPHFRILGESWFSVFFDFLDKHNCEYHGTLTNRKNIDGITKDRFPEIKEMEGINSYFYAIVNSPKYYDPTKEKQVLHAVIIDKNFNVVHDPNPNYLNIIDYPNHEILGYHGIREIFMIEQKK